jgi:hypothetical protein
MTFPKPLTRKQVRRQCHKTPKTKPIKVLGTFGAEHTFYFASEFITTRSQ